MSRDCPKVSPRSMMYTKWVANFATCTERGGVGDAGVPSFGTGSMLFHIYPFACYMPVSEFYQHRMPFVASFFTSTPLVLVSLTQMVTLV